MTQQLKSHQTTIAHPPFRCVSCAAALPVANGDPAETTCAQCGFAYRIGRDFIKYDADPLLFAQYKRQFLLYKVLSNNGTVAYQELKDTSLSVSGRPDVAAFRDFIQGAVPAGSILDVGCGTLPLPGYLDFADKSPYQFVGLDPLEQTEFQGTRVIGACEYLPFADDSFDALIFATSLDHVCSLERTASETCRVLKPGGSLLIWMGDRSQSLWRRADAALRTMARNVVRGYRTDKFVVYDNLSVFYVPSGAIDPFHSYPEKPANVLKLMRKAGLQFVEEQYRGPNEVFLHFRK